MARDATIWAGELGQRPERSSKSRSSRTDLGRSRARTLLRSRAFSILLSLATLKVAGALLGFLFGRDPARYLTQTPFPPSVSIAVMLVFAVTGGFLILGGRRDLRARYLGGAYLLIATSFSNRSLYALAERFPEAGEVVVLGLKHLEVDAFFALLFWAFARRFPRVAERPLRRTLGRLATLSAAALGGFLFLLNLAAGARALGWISGASLPARWLRETSGTWFYVPGFLLVLLALAYIAWRLQDSRRAERRRTQLFFGGLLLGLSPILLMALAEAVLPPLQRLFADTPGLRTSVAFFLYPCLLSAPASTAWAVLQRQVLDVRLVARQAIHYALTRAALAGLALLPFVALSLYLYEHRRLSLAELFVAPHLQLLLPLTALGIAAVAFRRRLREAVDRRFFRDRYDTRQILTLLAEQIRGTQRRADLARLVTGGIDRALHLESVALLIERIDLGSLVDPLGTVPHLDLTSPLVTLVASSPRPLWLDLGDPRSAAAHLSSEDRAWLKASGAVLLVPLVATDGRILGLLCLGEKKSTLPFLQEDRQLLGALATSAALVLEIQNSRQRQGLLTASPPPGDPIAWSELSSVSSLSSSALASSALGSSALTSSALSSSPILPFLPPPSSPDHGSFGRSGLEPRPEPAGNPAPGPDAGGAGAGPSGRAPGAPAAAGAAEDAPTQRWSLAEDPSSAGEGSAPGPPDDARPRGDGTALECLACGRLLPASGALARSASREPSTDGGAEAGRAPTCQACDGPLASAPVPFVIPGRLRFERRVGSGGMGLVYRAADLALGRPVAVKTLRRMSPEDAMLLRREARTAATTLHPHLALVFGLESWRDTPLLILEFLDGGTLGQRLLEGPLRPREVLDLGIAMTGALSALHRMEVLHRDVKPSNIGYTASGVPKLMDFGIARMQFDLRRDPRRPSSDVDELDSTLELTRSMGFPYPGTPEGGLADQVLLGPPPELDPGLLDPGDEGALPATSVWRESFEATARGHVLGTLGYLSPEVVRGAKPDPALDLWALSVVLFEALIGRPVFDTGDVKGALKAIRKAEIPDLLTLRPDCPTSLASLLTRCLSQEPEDRPGDAAALEESFLALRWSPSFERRRR